MKNRDKKVGNYVAYKGGSGGYITECFYCGSPIYMLEGDDGKWRPFESWAAGNATQGEWVFHDCCGSKRDRHIIQL